MVSPQRERTGARGAASLPRLSIALKIFCQFPVGHPPRRDAGRWSDGLVGTRALSMC